MAIDIKKLQARLDTSWERCQKDAANLNNLYEHIALLTTALIDTIHATNRNGNSSVQFGKPGNSPVIGPQLPPQQPGQLPSIKPL
jgi:hypothetical protein